MVDRQIARHLQNYEASDVELIMGSGRFIAPKTLEVTLNDGLTRVLAADKVFLNVGSHAAYPLGRVGQPDDLARIAVFLASDDSGWLTGDRLTAAGGYR